MTTKLVKNNKENSSIFKLSSSVPSQPHHSMLLHNDNEDCCDPFETHQHDNNAQHQHHADHIENNLESIVANNLFLSSPSPFTFNSNNNQHHHRQRQQQQQQQSNYYQSPISSNDIADKQIVDHRINKYAFDSSKNNDVVADQKENHPNSLKMFSYSSTSPSTSASSASSSASALNNTTTTNNNTNSNISSSSSIGLIESNLASINQNHSQSSFSSLVDSSYDKISLFQSNNFDFEFFPNSSPIISNGEDNSSNGKNDSFTIQNVYNNNNMANKSFSSSNNNFNEIQTENDALKQFDNRSFYSTISNDLNDSTGLSSSFGNHGLNVFEKKQANVTSSANIYDNDSFDSSSLLASNRINNHHQKQQQQQQPNQKSNNENQQQLHHRFDNHQPKYFRKRNNSHSNSIEINGGPFTNSANFNFNSNFSYNKFNNKNNNNYQDDDANKATTTTNQLITANYYDNFSLDESNTRNYYHQEELNNESNRSFLNRSLIRANKNNNNNNNCLFMQCSNHNLLVRNERDGTTFTDDENEIYANFKCNNCQQIKSMHMECYERFTRLLSTDQRRKRVNPIFISFHFYLL